VAIQSEGEYPQVPQEREPHVVVGNAAMPVHEVVAPVSSVAAFRLLLVQVNCATAQITCRNRGPTYPSRSTSPRNISTGRTQYE
jgi:hypothetical protein